MRSVPVVTRWIPPVTLPMWMDDAACRSADPELFFPGKGESATPAQRVCDRCPVSSDCLVHAAGLVADGQQVEGIWAGRRVSSLSRTQARLIVKAGRGMHGRRDDTEGHSHDGRPMGAERRAP